MTSIFASYTDKAWPHRFHGTIRVRNLAGGVPTDPKVAEGWLRTKLADKDDLIREAVAQTMVDRGYSITGSVDTVARKLEQAIEMFGIELLVLWMGVGPAPIDKLLRSNELLVEQVLPKIGIKLDRFEPTLRPEFATPRWTETP